MSADSICAVLSVEGLELGAMECRGNKEGRLKQIFGYRLKQIHHNKVTEKTDEKLLN